MRVPVTVRIEFSAGPVPGQLTAGVKFATVEGQPLSELPPEVIGVGHVLTLSNLSAEMVGGVKAHREAAAVRNATGG